MADFEVKFGNIGGTFDFSVQDGKKFKASMGEVNEIHIGAAKYDGVYEVVPKADEAQTLPTKNTILSEDVTVLAVPFYETDNQKGTTIFIASEV